MWVYAQASRRKVSSRPTRARAAFTLMEILLVVGVLGFVGLLFVNASTDLFRSRELRPDDVLWQGVNAARQLALETNQTVRLSYDEKQNLLVWSAPGGTAHTLPYPGKSLDFFAVDQQSTVLIGGQLMETNPMTQVRFYADGACDAFRAQLVETTGRRSVLAIDPWTCAPMLAAEPK